MKEELRKRVEELIQQASTLSIGDQFGQVFGDEQIADCVGWLASARNAVHLICSPTEAYWKAAEAIIDEATPPGYVVHTHVMKLQIILKNLVDDMDRGLLASVASVAQAEVFDDLLDQAEEYVKRSQMNGASVLASAVFEDTIRRIGIANGIQNDSLEQVINGLKSAGLFNSITAKRCKASADLRNSALHADWSAFSMEDVKTVIAQTRGLIEAHLAA